MSDSTVIELNWPAFYVNRLHSYFRRQFNDAQMADPTVTTEGVMSVKPKLVCVGQLPVMSDQYNLWLILNSPEGKTVHGYDIQSEAGVSYPVHLCLTQDSHLIDNFRVEGHYLAGYLDKGLTKQGLCVAEIGFFRDSYQRPKPDFGGPPVVKRVASSWRFVH